MARFQLKSIFYFQKNAYLGAKIINFIKKESVMTHSKRCAWYLDAFIPKKTHIVKEYLKKIKKSIFKFKNNPKSSYFS